MAQKNDFYWKEKNDMLFDLQTSLQMMIRKALDMDTGHNMGASFHRLIFFCSTRQKREKRNITKNNKQKKKFEKG